MTGVYPKLQATPKEVDGCLTDGTDDQSSCNVSSAPADQRASWPSLVLQLDIFMEPRHDERLLNDQWAIAEQLNLRLEQLQQAGMQDKDLFSHMGPHMALVQRLATLASPQQMSILLTEFKSLALYSKLLIQVASAMSARRSTTYNCRRVLRTSRRRSG